MQSLPQTRSTTAKQQLRAYLSEALPKLKDAELLVCDAPGYNFDDINRIADLVDGVQSALNDLCDLEP